MHVAHLVAGQALKAGTGRELALEAQKPTAHLSGLTAGWQGGECGATTRAKATNARATCTKAERVHPWWAHLSAAVAVVGARAIAPPGTWPACP